MYLALNRISKRVRIGWDKKSHRSELGMYHLSLLPESAPALRAYYRLKTSPNALSGLHN